MTKKKRSKKTKEMQLSANIAKGDLETKINKAKAWLAKGDRVKICTTFKGREIVHKEVGLRAFDEAVKALLASGAVISSPKKDEGKTVTIILDSKSL